MRICRQVIYICLVYLIPFSLCESDCLSQKISSDNGCATYRASSSHPGRPCRLMQKTVPPFTFFFKPESDFMFMTTRVIRAVTPYSRVQYGSLKLRRGILKQRGGWNEIVLRHRTTTNFRGLTWISYFLEINGQQKDISNDPEHTVAATNFQIFINGGVQWRAGCGRTLNGPILVPGRTTINSTVNDSPTTMLPTELHAATIPMSMITSPETTSSVLTSENPATTVISNITILTIMPRFKTITTSVPIETVPTAMENKTTTFMKWPTSITEPGGIIRSDLDIQTISSTSLPTSKPTIIPSPKSTMQEGPATTKLPRTIPTEMPTTTSVLPKSNSTAILQTKLPAESRPTTYMPTSVRHTTPISVPSVIMLNTMPIKTTMATATEDNLTGEQDKISQITTISLNTDEDTTASSVIIVTEEEAKEHIYNITSKPTSSIASKMYTSEMQNFTSIRIFSDIIDQKYYTSTEYPTTFHEVTAFPDSVTTFSSLLITKIISTVHTENHSTHTSADMTTSPDKTERLVTSTLSTSEITVPNTTKPRKPRLNNNSLSEESIANKKSSSLAFGSELPLPLWQMIICAVLIDIAIVILALCIFMIIYRCKKKLKSKRLHAEIDHVAFSEYIKKNLQPNSTEADAESLYGGQIGPGVDSEKDEIDPDVFENYIKRNLQPNRSGADADSLYGQSSRIEQGSDSNLESNITQNEDRNLDG